MQRAKNTEKNIEGKKGGLTLVNKKIYYKATVIKGVSFFCKDSQIHQIQQRNRSENLQSVLHLHGWLIFEKGHTAKQGGKKMACSIEVVGTIGYPNIQNESWPWHHTTH